MGVRGWRIVIFWLYSIGAFFVLFLFPALKRPLRLGSALLALSLILVIVSSINVGWWYSYIFFLVYVGGLLVLFIYACLISRNQEFSPRGSLSWVLVFAIPASTFIHPYYHLGAFKYDEGPGIIQRGNLWLLGFLVMLLLVVILTVVRSCYDKNL